MTKPLTGVRIVEMGGIGPIAFAGMILAELGAEVVRVDRPNFAGYEGAIDPRLDITNRGKRSVVLDVSTPQGREALMTMVAKADALIEGFRPGVAERLGIGPHDCAAVNPRLVFGRMTGWGQSGPLANSAGHDANYIAITGALFGIGSPGVDPQVPLNIVGDMGAGGTYMVIGVLAAILEARGSGAGQVVDAAIVDGTAHLLSIVHALLASGTMVDERGANIHNGIAPFHNVYGTLDGRYVMVAAAENRFYRIFLEILGVDIDPACQGDRTQWPAWRDQIAARFREKTRDEWDALFDGTDACVSPILSFREAADHPHMAERGSLVHVDGVLQAGPAPRFSRTPTTVGSPPPAPGQDTIAVLEDWGVAGIQGLIDSGTASQA